MKIILKYSLIIALTVLATACQSDDDDSSPKFTATINGEVWKATDFSVYNGLYFHTASMKGFKLAAYDEDHYLAVNISETGYSKCMAVGNYNFSGSISYNYRLPNGEWSDAKQGYSHYMDTDENGDLLININVTSCNNNVISGNFTASLTGDTEPWAPNHITITNGKFENIEFDIIQ